MLVPSVAVVVKLACCTWRRRSGRKVTPSSGTALTAAVMAAAASTCANHLSLGAVDRVYNGGFAKLLHI